MSQAIHVILRRSSAPIAGLSCGQNECDAAALLIQRMNVQVPSIQRCDGQSTPTLDAEHRNIKNNHARQ